MQFLLGLFFMKNTKEPLLCYPCCFCVAYNLYFILIYVSCKSVEIYITFIEKIITEMS